MAQRGGYECGFRGARAVAWKQEDDAVPFTAAAAACWLSFILLQLARLSAPVTMPLDRR